MMRFAPTKRENDWFDDMFSTFGGMSAGLMKTDIREKDGRYLLDVDLPGFKKEDIKISLYNGTLTVSAEHNENNDEKDAKGSLIRQERYSGSCTRSWYVGEGISESDIKAAFNNGTLTLEIPTVEKKAETETKYIDIL